MNGPKYLQAALAGALILSLAVPLWAQDWPPLNAHESQSSQAAHVGGYDFVQGFYSWRVEGYRADQVRYSRFINHGLRRWEIEIGPRGVHKYDSSAPREGSGASQPPASGVELVPLPPLSREFSALPRLSAMPGLPVVNSGARDNGRMPVLGDLPPLPRLESR